MSMRMREEEKSMELVIEWISVIPKENITLSVTIGKELTILVR